MNPLLFIPSPRDIPEVKRHWPTFQHDIYLVKYQPQIDAYYKAQQFFLNHKEYTHLVVMPDDLEVTSDVLEILLSYADDYPVISGYCNLQEDQPDIYNLQQQVIMDDISPKKHKGAWIEKDDLDKYDTIFQVKHAGFGCEVINRESFEKCRFTSTELPEGGTHGGNFDYAFSQDMNRHGIPIHVHKDCKLYHWRMKQYHNLIKEYPFEWLIKNEVHP